MLFLYIQLPPERRQCLKKVMEEEEDKVMMDAEAWEWCKVSSEYLVSLVDHVVIG